MPSCSKIAHGQIKKGTFKLAWWSYYYLHHSFMPELAEPWTLPLTFFARFFGEEPTETVWSPSSSKATCLYLRFLSIVVFSGLLSEDEATSIFAGAAAGAFGLRTFLRPFSMVWVPRSLVLTGLGYASLLLMGFLASTSQLLLPSSMMKKPLAASSACCALNL